MNKEAHHLNQFAHLFCLVDGIGLAEINLNKPITSMGRDYRCDIVIPSDQVSRVHAEIAYYTPQYILTDNESTNGTYVNGKTLTNPHLLRNDDLIGLGVAKALFRFVDPDPTRKVQGHISFDEVTLIFFWREHPLNLTPREFRFLHFLYKNQDEVCSRNQCAVAVWRRPYEPGSDDEGLDKIVSIIRSKCRLLNTEVNPRNVIQTRRELGFQLCLDQ